MVLAQIDPIEIEPVIVHTFIPPNVVWRLKANATFNIEL